MCVFYILGLSEYYSLLYSYKLGEKLADKAAAADAPDGDSAKRKAVDSPATGKAGKARKTEY